MNRFSKLVIALCIGLFALSTPILAESQDSDDYEGVTDPFGDPGQYEFSSDEKADKEFFHLGRFFMMGFDLGMGIYTGGLGRNTSPGLNFGGRILYFFDKQLGFEFAVHFSRQTYEAILSGSNSIIIDMDLLPITGGFRFYFDTKSAPKAIALANPYLAFGGGAYLRTQTLIQGANTGIDQDTSSSFGFYAGAGVEFPFYRRHLYLGLDIRYHFVFFPDEDDNLGSQVEAGERGGDFFAPSVTITYSF